MQKILYSIVAVLVVAISAFLYLQKDDVKDVRNYPSVGTDIIAFGDSLIAGTGATSPDNSFVALLSKQIGEPIINLGVPGDTTAMGLARLNELDEYNPKLILLLLGGNDHLKKVPIDTTFENLAKIIENLQQRGAVVLLLGVRGNLLSDKFAPEFEKLSKRYKTAYVPDVLKGLFGNGKYMSDAVHPNDAGNSEIAKRIYPVLIKLVR